MQRKRIDQISQVLQAKYKSDLEKLEGQSAREAQELKRTTASLKEHLTKALRENVVLKK